MKRIWCVFIVCLLASSSFTQQSKIDSIHRLPPIKPEGIDLVERYYALLRYHSRIDQYDSLNYYTQKLLEVSRRLDYPLGEFKAKFVYAQDFNNIPKALEASYECLDLSQKMGDTVALMNTLFMLNVVYRQAAGQYDKSVAFGKQLLTLATAATDSMWIWNALYVIGVSYSFLQQKDSCLLYFQECYRYAQTLHNRTQRWVFRNDENSKGELNAWSLSGLGKAHQILNDHDLALVYFLKALSFAAEIPKGDFVAEVYMGIAGVYMKMNKPDSVIYYSKLWLEAARNDNMHTIGAATMLARGYEGRNNDSAVKYFKMAAEVREIQFSDKNNAEVDNIEIKAAEKQREIAAQQTKVREERKRNLQFVSIGVGLISFLVLFLLLSRTIIVRSGFVRFLGLIGLILVFEFINLLLHPFIGGFAHHSPFWMFLTMVCIAALLVPAHHKLEKWVTYQLVEKNKRIRLAAAKRTIAKLESE